MTTQDQAAIEKVMTRTSEMSMQKATISEMTKNFLIILGKLSDIYENISQATELLCGEKQLDETVEPVFKELGNVRDEVGKLLVWSIREKMARINSHEI